MIERFLIQALMKEFPISTTIKWCLIQALRKEFSIPTTIKNFLTLFKRTNNFPTLIEEGKLPSSHPSPLELHSGSQESCPSCEIGNKPFQTPQIYNSNSCLVVSSSLNLWFWFKIGDFKLLALLSRWITYLFVGPVKFLRTGLFGRRSWN